MMPSPHNQDYVSYLGDVLGSVGSPQTGGHIPLVHAPRRASYLLRSFYESEVDITSIDPSTYEAIPCSPSPPHHHSRLPNYSPTPTHPSQVSPMHIRNCGSLNTAVNEAPLSGDTPVISVKSVSTSKTMLSPHSATRVNANAGTQLYPITAVTNSSHATYQLQMSPRPSPLEQEYSTCTDEGPPKLSTSSLGCNIHSIETHTTRKVAPLAYPTIMCTSAFCTTERQSPYALSLFPCTISDNKHSYSSSLGHRSMSEGVSETVDVSGGAGARARVLSRTRSRPAMHSSSLLNPSHKPSNTHMSPTLTEVSPLLHSPHLPSSLSSPHTSHTTSISSPSTSTSSPGSSHLSFSSSYDSTLPANTTHGTPHHTPHTTPQNTTSPRSRPHSPPRPSPNLRRRVTRVLRLLPVLRAATPVLSSSLHFLRNAPRTLLKLSKMRFPVYFLLSVCRASVLATHVAKSMALAATLAGLSQSPLAKPLKTTASVLGALSKALNNPKVTAVYQSPLVSTCQTSTHTPVTLFFLPLAPLVRVISIAVIVTAAVAVSQVGLRALGMRRGWYGDLSGAMRKRERKGGNGEEEGMGAPFTSPRRRAARTGRYTGMSAGMSTGKNRSKNRGISTNAYMERACSLTPASPLPLPPREPPTCTHTPTPLPPRTPASSALTHTSLPLTHATQCSSPSTTRHTRTRTTPSTAVSAPAAAAAATTDRDSDSNTWTRQLDQLYSELLTPRKNPEKDFFRSPFSGKKVSSGKRTLFSPQNSKIQSVSPCSSLPHLSPIPYQNHHNKNDSNLGNDKIGEDNLTLRADNRDNHKDKAKDEENGTLIATDDNNSVYTTVFSRLSTVLLDTLAPYLLLALPTSLTRKADEVAKALLVTLTIPPFRGDRSDGGGVWSEEGSTRSVSVGGAGYSDDDMLQGVDSGVCVYRHANHNTCISSSSSSLSMSPAPPSYCFSSASPPLSVLFSRYITDMATQTLNSSAMRAITNNSVVKTTTIIMKLLCRIIEHISVPVMMILRHTRAGRYLLQSIQRIRDIFKGFLKNMVKLLYSVGKGMLMTLDSVMTITQRHLAEMIHTFVYFMRRQVGALHPSVLQDAVKRVLVNLVFQMRCHECTSYAYVYTHTHTPTQAHADVHSHVHVEDSSQLDAEVERTVARSIERDVVGSANGSSDKGNKHVGQRERDAMSGYVGHEGADDGGCDDVAIGTLKAIVEEDEEGKDQIIEKEAIDEDEGSSRRMGDVDICEADDRYNEDAYIRALSQIYTHAQTRTRTMKYKHTEKSTDANTDALYSEFTKENAGDVIKAKHASQVRSLTTSPSTSASPAVAMHPSSSLASCSSSSSPVPNDSSACFASSQLASASTPPLSRSSTPVLLSSLPPVDSCPTCSTRLRAALLSLSSIALWLSLRPAAQKRLTWVPHDGVHGDIHKSMWNGVENCSYGKGAGNTILSLSPSSLSSCATSSHRSLSSAASPATPLCACSQSLGICKCVSGSNFLSGKNPVPRLFLSGLVDMSTGAGRHPYLLLPSASLQTPLPSLVTFPLTLPLRLLSFTRATITQIHAHARGIAYIYLAYRQLHSVFPSLANAAETAVTQRTMRVIHSVRAAIAALLSHFMEKLSTITTRIQKKTAEVVYPYMRACQRGWTAILTTCRRVQAYVLAIYRRVVRIIDIILGNAHNRNTLNTNNGSSSSSSFVSSFAATSTSPTSASSSIAPADLTNTSASHTQQQRLLAQQSLPQHALASRMLQQQQQLNIGARRHTFDGYAWPRQQHNAPPLPLALPVPLVPVKAAGVQRHDTTTLPPLRPAPPHQHDACTPIASETHMHANAALTDMDISPSAAQAAIAGHTTTMGHANAAHNATVSGAAVGPGDAADADVTTVVNTTACTAPAVFNSSTTPALSPSSSSLSLSPLPRSVPLLHSTTSATTIAAASSSSSSSFPSSTSPSSACKQPQLCRSSPLSPNTNTIPPTSSPLSATSSPSSASTASSGCIQPPRRLSLVPAMRLSLASCFNVLRMATEPTPAPASKIAPMTTQVLSPPASSSPTSSSSPSPHSPSPSHSSLSPAPTSTLTSTSTFPSHSSPACASIPETVAVTTDEVAVVLRDDEVGHRADDVCVIAGDANDGSGDDYDNHANTEVFDEDVCEGKQHGEEEVEDVEDIEGKQLGQLPVDEDVDVDVEEEEAAWGEGEENQEENEQEDDDGEEGVDIDESHVAEADYGQQHVHVDVGTEHVDASDGAYNTSVNDDADTGVPDEYDEDDCGNEGEVCDAIESDCGYDTGATKYVRDPVGVMESQCQEEEECSGWLMEEEVEEEEESPDDKECGYKAEEITALPGDTHTDGIAMETTTMSEASMVTPRKPSLCNTSLSLESTTTKSVSREFVCTETLYRETPSKETHFRKSRAPRPSLSTRQSLLLLSSDRRRSRYPQAYRRLSALCDALREEEEYGSDEEEVEGVKEGIFDGDNRAGKELPVYRGIAAEVEREVMICVDAGAWTEAQDKQQEQEEDEVDAAHNSVKESSSLTFVRTDAQDTAMKATTAKCTDRSSISTQSSCISSVATWTSDKSGTAQRSIGYRSNGQPTRRALTLDEVSRRYSSLSGRCSDSQSASVDNMGRQAGLHTDINADANIHIIQSARADVAEDVAAAEHVDATPQQLPLQPLPLHLLNTSLNAHTRTNTITNVRGRAPPHALRASYEQITSQTHGVPVKGNTKLTRLSTASTPHLSTTTTTATQRLSWGRDGLTQRPAPGVSDATTQRVPDIATQQPQDKGVGMGMPLAKRSLALSTPHQRSVSASTTASATMAVVSTPSTLAGHSTRPIGGHGGTARSQTRPSADAITALPTLHAVAHGTNTSARSTITKRSGRSIGLRAVASGNGTSGGGDGSGSASVNNNGNVSANVLTGENNLDPFLVAFSTATPQLQRYSENLGISRFSESLVDSVRTKDREFKLSQ